MKNLAINEINAAVGGVFICSCNSDPIKVMWINDDALAMTFKKCFEECKQYCGKLGYTVRA